MPNHETNPAHCLLKASSGTGNGTVNFSVSPNQTGTPRSGTVTIAGLAFTVNQAGVLCSYSLGTTTQFFGAGAGTGNVSVIAPSGCNW